MNLKTASKLFKSGRYIYVVFMCHLSIEKILKAIICKRRNELPPYTHNLNRLIELADIFLDEQNHDFVNRISLQSVPTGYPEDFTKLAKEFTKKVAGEHLKRTKEVVKCLKEQLTFNSRAYRLSAGRF